MNQPRSPFDGFLLFQEQPDIWNSLDKAAQEQVLQCLALLLLQYHQQTARCAADERSHCKGHST
jgi:hypothetical protein